MAVKALKSESSRKTVTYTHVPEGAPHKNNLCQEYNEILKEWERDGVIEEVPESELDKFAHYLPHTTMWKLSSNSTKIRPVFDASLHERRN